VIGAMACVGLHRRRHACAMVMVTWRGSWEGRVDLPYLFRALRFGRRMRGRGHGMVVGGGHPVFRLRISVEYNGLPAGFRAFFNGF
jgi:hypothetical protein